MFRTIVRNYRNAGVQVTVSLLIEETPGQEPATFAVFKGTGLAVHDLATKGRRELLRQARFSKMRRGQRFEEIAWSVAAYSIRSSLPSIKANGASETGFVLPYMCLLAERLSLTWADGETRDVIVDVNESVYVHSVANLLSRDVLLQEGKPPIFGPPPAAPGSSPAAART